MNKQIVKQAQKLVAENSAALLTGTGVVGVITTAVLTSRATVKAQEIIAKHERHSYDVIEDVDNGTVEVIQEKLFVLDTVDKVKLTWPLFIPPAASAVTTMSAVVFSYRISVSKSAALAAAYGLTDKAFNEYKEKVLEQVTPKKATDIQDAVDKQQLVNTPPPDASVMIIGAGKVLCLDPFSSQYFESTVENIRKAQNKMNSDIDTHNVARLNDYYEIVGIPPSDMSDEFVWHINNYCEIDFTTQLADDGRPVLVCTFVNAPKVLFGDHPYA